MKLPMTDQQGPVTAPLNFAADRSVDGIWSNFSPEIRTQKLVAVPVAFADARALPQPPSLEREGFALRHDPVASPRWHDPAWIEQVYLTRSLALIGRLTGASMVAPFQGGMTIIRDTGDPAFAPAADFVHLDQSRGSVQQFIDRAAPEHYARVELFNLWRAITPPPQDVPLALCDQRTLEESDWVLGNTLEPGMTVGSPYTTSVFNAGQRWHYFPAVSPDEVLVFRQWDTRPDQPVGCLHGAFRWPGELPGAIPRASIELRIFAFFD